MRVTRPIYVTGAVALCLLSLPLALLGRAQPVPGREAAARPACRVRPGSPSAVALRAAERCWGKALMAVKPELEALAAWDPGAAPGVEEDWRCQLMARDLHGRLREAQTAAWRAVLLARTPVEEHRAREWLAIIECDRGQHREELEQAWRLVALQPGNAESWGALRRAARCNGLSPVARKADRMAQMLSKGQAPAPSRLLSWAAGQGRGSMVTGPPSTTSRVTRLPESSDMPTSGPPAALTTNRPRRCPSQSTSAR